jgi:hypothetical protein
LKRHVSGWVPAGRVEGFITSSFATMNTGASLAMARCSRSRCVAVSTSCGFCSTPVACTMWSCGTVIETS